jgi:phosphoribosylanthranilate isomerase
MEFCETFGLPYIKALRVRADRDITSAISNYSSANFILLDSFNKNFPGGTGETFDWSRAVAANATKGINLIVAGGLNSSNVRQAVEQVRPFGVDASSGIEIEPGISGIKDRRKMQVFIEAARGAGIV